MATKRGSSTLELEHPTKRKWYESTLLRAITADGPQAEIIGTTAGVVGLVGAAFTVVREVRAARDKVREELKTMDDASQQLAALERSLRLVQEEKPLQTADAAQQTRGITGIADEIKAFFDKLAIEQQKQTARGLYTRSSPAIGRTEIYAGFSTGSTGRERARLTHFCGRGWPDREPRGRIPAASISNVMMSSFWRSCPGLLPIS